MDPAALIQSIGQAAKALGWRVQPGLDEDWDMDLWTPGMRMAIRCVGAGVAIGSGVDGRNVIADAWRVLALTPSPPRGTRACTWWSCSPTWSMPARKLLFDLRWTIGERRTRGCRTVCRHGST
jgi:hypothetical protein